MMILHVLFDGERVEMLLEEAHAPFCSSDITTKAERDIVCRLPSPSRPIPLLLLDEAGLYVERVDAFRWALRYCFLFVPSRSSPTPFDRVPSCPCPRLSRQHDAATAYIII